MLAQSPCLVGIFSPCLPHVYLKPCFQRNTSSTCGGALHGFPHLQHIRVDGGYGKSAQDWISQHWGWTVEVVKQPRQPRGVWAAPDVTIDWEALLPKGCRGVLPRRLSRDYERLSETSVEMACMS